MSKLCSNINIRKEKTIHLLFYLSKLSVVARRTQALIPSEECAMLLKRRSIIEEMFLMHSLVLAGNVASVRNSRLRVAVPSLPRRNGGEGTSTQT